MFVVILLVISAVVFIVFNKNFYVDNEKNNSYKQVTAQKPFDLYEHYKIVKLSDNDYSLVLYGKGNTKVKEENYPKKPSIDLLEDETIQITISVGSPASYVHYFDVKTNKISDVYFNPILAQSRRIVYMDDEGKLIISDIFDKKKIYGKIVRDFSPTADASSAILEAKFQKDNKLYIDYLKGTDLVETSEIINLNQ